MLTVEKVLETFADFLAEDQATEVIKVRHGYLVFFYDERGEEYSFNNLCRTPHELMDELLDSYGGYLDYLVVKQRDGNLNGDPTDEEKAVNGKKVAELKAMCLENCK